MCTGRAVHNFTHVLSVLLRKRSEGCCIMSFASCCVQLCQLLQVPCQEMVFNMASAAGDAGWP